MSVHESFGSGTFKTNPALKPNDVILTPEPIAKEMIALYDIPEGAKVLDPCSGEGVFYVTTLLIVKRIGAKLAKGGTFSLTPIPWIGLLATHHIVSLKSF